MAVGRVFENGDKVTAKAVHVTSLAECTRRFGTQNKTKMVNGRVLSVFTKKIATGRNSRCIRGRFDLGGGALKVADINVRSIKLVEVGTEIPEEATETSKNETELVDPVIEAEVACHDGSPNGEDSLVATTQNIYRLR